MRRRLTSLKLTAIAAVTQPCQEGAKAVLMKVAPEAPSALAAAVAKYVGTDDGAHSFDEVLAENRLSEIIWPLADAFMQSVRSIVGDKTLATASRETMIAESVDEFLSAVRSRAPAADAEKVESELEKLSKGDPNMKTIEQLTAEVEKLTGQMTAATAQIATLTTEKTAAETERDALKAKVDEPAQELATVKTELATTKAALAAATDETLKVGEREIKKSVVGEDMFAITKAQQEETALAKAEVRAEADFGLVVGTAAEKAVVLRAIDALPEPAQKAAVAILESAQAMAKAGFERFGVTGEQAKTVEKANLDFEAKVTEIAKRDSCPRTEAMQKARQEAPELFEAMQEADA